MRKVHGQTTVADANATLQTNAILRLGPVLICVSTCACSVSQLHEFLGYDVRDWVILFLRPWPFWSLRSSTWLILLSALRCFASISSLLSLSLSQLSLLLSLLGCFFSLSAWADRRSLCLGWVAGWSDWVSVSVASVMEISV